MNEQTVAPPIAIEIAIHYHAFTGDYRDGDLSAPAVQKWINILVKRQILAFSSNPAKRQYEAGPAMPAYIEALCQVPFPVARWVVPKENRNVID